MTQRPQTMPLVNCDGHTLYLPHTPKCKLTKLTDGQVILHKLGLFPVRCASCGDLMPAEGRAT
jgi:hypothetical protein